MTQFLLDTNIVSDLIRNPRGTVTRHIEAVGEERIATSIVVACELRFGAAKRNSAALAERIESLLTRMRVLSLTPGVDHIYGSIRSDLEAMGRPIGANDLLIAAHTLHLSRTEDWILVTANTAKFERVNGLGIENWLSSEPNGTV